MDFVDFCAAFASTPQYHASFEEYGRADLLVDFLVAVFVGANVVLGSTSSGSCMLVSSSAFFSLFDLLLTMVDKSSVLRKDCSQWLTNQWLTNQLLTNPPFLGRIAHNR